MAITTAFGSITIVDITDIGEFSVYPMSNLPLSVIYTPDEGTYAPDWSVNNLKLTPSIFYAGKALTTGTDGLSITWQKMSGITATSLSATEVKGSDGVLTVSRNQFTGDSAPITYTVTAEYIEPTSQTTLTAQGQITFSLIRMASEVRNVVISGNNVFKYNTNGVPTPSSITLTATPTNTTILRWEYSNNDGQTWTSTNVTTSTYSINNDSSIFSNDSVLVRVVASDKNDSDSLYYDYTTIIKLRDGAPGKSTVAMVLNNEDQMIPCDSSGNPTTSAFNLAYTSCIIYEGGTDVTSSYTVKAVPTGVVGAWTNSNSTKPTGASTEATKGSNAYYWVTGWGASNNSDIGYVTFTATKGTTTITKTMSLSKIKTGADGVSPVVHSLDLSTLIVNKSYTYNSSGALTGTTFTPSTITAKAYQTVGDTTSSDNGYIKVYVDSTTTVKTAGATSSGSYSVSGLGTTYSPISYILFELYDSSATGAKLLDSQRVMITSDGSKGIDGAQGESAINLDLGNYSDTIAVSTSYKPTAAVSLVVPFAVYEGTTMIPSTITAANAAITMGSKTITPVVVNSTSSSYGTLTYSLTTSDVIGSSTIKNGSKSLSFSYTTLGGATGTATAIYSWALTVAPVNGTSPIMLQISTPNGYIFSNGDGTLSIVAQLMNGANQQTSGVTYQWSKFTNGSYVNISGATSATLSVNGSTVDGYASYRCAATYLSKTYYGYVSLMDKTDPIQVTIFSTIGTQIVNGKGVGAFYAIVMQNGVEVDPLKTDKFVTAKPASMTTGDLYYFTDASSNSVKLMKATSTTAWSQQTDPSYTGTYTWSYRNSNNESITTGTPASTGKVIYIDADLIDKKIIIDVEVEI